MTPIRSTTRRVFNIGAFVVPAFTPLIAFATSPTPDIIIEPELIEAPTPVIRAHITYDMPELRRRMAGCTNTVTASAKLLGGVVVGTTSASAEIVSDANYVSVDTPVKLADRDGIFPSSLQLEFRCRNHIRKERIRLFVKHEGGQRTLVSYEEYRQQFDRLSNDARAAVGPQTGERDGEQLLPAHLRGLRCGQGLSCRSAALRSSEGGE